MACAAVEMLLRRLRMERGGREIKAMSVSIWARIGSQSALLVIYIMAGRSFLCGVKFCRCYDEALWVMPTTLSFYENRIGNTARKVQPP